MHDSEPTGSTAAADSRGEALSSAEAGTAWRLPTVSLELFPPQPDRVTSATWGRTDRLLATGPNFVSAIYRPTFVTDPAGEVTGGGHQRSAHEPEAGRCKTAPRIRAVREQTNPSECVPIRVLDSSIIPLMAHLTCIGYRKQEAVDIVTRFLCVEVRCSLVLRGNPPVDTWAENVAGELHHAGDLVRVIREVEADFSDDGGCHATIAVIVYPAANDHIETIEVLVAKQAAGADMTVTQVFYGAADYVTLTNAASYTGVNVPTLPGVTPLTDLRRLTRLKALTGACVPAGLRPSLGSISGATLAECGIGATLDLATALLHAGAPGLHLYTFNRTRLALDVISHLRLGGILAGAAPDRGVRDAINREHLQATPGRGPPFLRRDSARATVSSHHPIWPLTTITRENV